MLATEYDTIRFEKLNIVNMTASARGTTGVVITAALSDGRSLNCNADLKAAINVAAGPCRRDDARKRRASVNQQSGPRGPLLESPSL